MNAQQPSRQRVSVEGTVEVGGALLRFWRCWIHSDTLPIDGLKGWRGPTPNNTARVFLTKNLSGLDELGLAILT